MTCQELHCYLENPLRVEIYIYRESLPAPVSEHLAACEECARLFEEQKALGVGLSMVRDAAPQVPVAVDAKVLANYRRQLVEPDTFRTLHLWSFPNSWLRWGVAAAVIAVIATTVFLSRNHSPIMAKRVAPVEKQLPGPVQEQRPEVSEKRTLGVGSPKHEVSAARVHTKSVGTNRSPLPPGFASLMYCDELTCTGAMEVIRVEIPPAAGQTPGPTATPVMAEVLVGADGIARGIRIVQ